MSDASRSLRASLNARLVACSEAELRAVDAELVRIEKLRCAASRGPRLQIEIARDRLVGAATIGNVAELERAALAFAVAVADQTRAIARDVLEPEVAP